MIAGMALLATARKPAAVIAVAPVGEAPAAEVAALVPVLSESFGCEIVIAPAVPLPARAWNASRRQYLSTTLLDSLARAKRPEWERLLGVADVDLYVPSLNFVFGEGDSSRGVAVNVRITEIVEATPSVLPHENREAGIVFRAKWREA